jgi:two-component system, chemotaxis family, sensor kinase CheA
MPLPTTTSHCPGGPLRLHSAQPEREANLGESFDLSGLLEEYRDEARGQLDELDAALLRIERQGTLSEPEAVSLLRALHTLKGNSGMLGFAALRDYVHAIEGVLKPPPAQWTQPLLDSLFEGAAALRRAVEQAGTTEEPAALARLASLRIPEASPGPPAPSPPPPPRPEPEAPVAADPGPRDAAAPSAPPEDADDAEPAADAPRLEVATELLRVPFAKLDALANLVAELLGAHAALDDLLDTHRVALESAGLRRPLQTRVEQLERVAAALRRTTTDLRLVPVGRVLRRFPSLVRDLAREQGKRIRVAIEGEETEMDKSTVDILAEPLLHLVRNAVDHGIQPPDVRVAAGKAPEGTITLRALSSGDTVRIEVEDDGMGLDRARILERARTSGLVGDEEPLTDDEIAELIFRPGFSTRQQADLVSGRGIGMDIVASSVTRLRGSLEVEDSPGEGSRFVLRLPLTIAILPALLFESRGQTLALPALEVEDTQRLGTVGWAAGAEVVALDGELVPLVRVESVFVWNGTGAPDSSPSGASAAPKYVLVVRRGARAAAVAADRVLEQRDVVVKALPAFLGNPRGVSGATIAPDGRVILLLDAGGIIDLNLESHRRTGRVAKTGENSDR